MSDGEQQPEWMRHVEWITILGQNIMAAANDLRPIQVRHVHIDQVYFASEPT